MKRCKSTLELNPALVKVSKFGMVQRKDNIGQLIQLGNILQPPMLTNRGTEENYNATCFAIDSVPPKCRPKLINERLYH